MEAVFSARALAEVVHALHTDGVQTCARELQWV